MYSISNCVYRAVPVLRSHLPAIFKHTIDSSRVPELKEHEIEEKFIRGSGPGGSAVNKNSNCVMLKHTPTGIVIKCHQSRCLDDNRRTARQQLINKLDELENGEDSVAAQRRRLEERRYARMQSKRDKRQRVKEEWMRREGLK